MRLEHQMSLKVIKSQQKVSGHHTHLYSTSLANLKTELDREVVTLQKLLSGLKVYSSESHETLTQTCQNLLKVHGIYSQVLFQTKGVKNV